MAKDRFPLIKIDERQPVYIDGLVGINVTAEMLDVTRSGILGHEPSLTREYEPGLLTAVLAFSNRIESYEYIGVDENSVLCLRSFPE
jgi:hypothetical protein